MRSFLTIILTFLVWTGFSQSFPFRGNVYSTDGTPMIYSSVVLLNPSDSTMQSFGITNKEGFFEIKNVKKGDYLLQSSFLGYETYYQKITIPAKDNSIGTLVMKPKPVNVNEVKITADYIPISIRKDTVEFNAAAFKLKPDAVTEDLLKKLPGVEVDRAGNIKAMGEDVKKLYVDGKEFFGNDPKVATKNVPADAVDKVQVYDRKSEESMFTGIDDGSHQKTINLKLKEEKKNGVFGDLMAGGGTSEHWQGNAKAYRFSEKTQIAALGMANNINQYGFSFNDYMNFSGGMGAMIHGGGSAQIRISSDGSFPINFGESVSGLNKSGAGGANFSYSTNPNKRVFMSYLGNGSRKDLEQTTKSWNYTSNNSFEQNENLGETSKNSGHNINFGWRNRIDSTKNLILDGNLSISDGNNSRNSDISTSQNLTLVNSLQNINNSTSDRLSGNATSSYIKKMNYGKSVFKVNGSFSLSKSLSENLIHTTDRYFINNQWSASRLENKFQNNQSDIFNWSLGTTFTQKAGKRIYIEPEIQTGNNYEFLNRSQGFTSPGIEIDSLSPEFTKNYTWFRPKVGFIRNTTKTKISLSLQAESGSMKNKLNNKQEFTRNLFYLLPSAMCEYEYQTGRRIMAIYNAGVNTPNITQLLPVVNNLNPLAIYYGNPDLKPEVQHRMNAHWLLFDQFSFTSLMATLSGTMTKDKINWDRTIKENFAFINKLTNVKKDFNVNSNVDFSTPIRKAGMKIHVNLSEGWNKGLNIINNKENEYSNYTHKASVSFDNRKKEKWDVNTGVELSLTNSRYTIQKALNNNYFDMSWFGEIRFTPNDKWNFEVSSDVSNYSDKSFEESLTIPLLNFEISRFLLKNKRGTLTLRGFDMLNKNSIVKRFSELNYLREIRSNSIGRFVMLSFNYRLNKFGGQGNSIDIKVRK